jgi:hypothetical protein
MSTPRAALPGLRLVLALTVPLLGFACAPEATEPFVGDVSRSEFWEYHDQVTESLCPALLPLLDQHARQMANTLGMALEPERPFRYYRFRDQPAAAKACGVPAGGCARDGDVFSPHYFDAHEQAHAYVRRGWGDQSVPLLNEGVAVALSCSQFGTLDPERPPFESLGSPAWRDLYARESLSISGYTAAGIWVTFLAQHHGWRAVAELHQRVPIGASAEDFAREFARVIPSSMDRAWSEALAAPGAPYCVDDWLCEAPSMMPAESVAPCNGQTRRTILVPDDASGLVLSMGAPAAGCVVDSGVLNCYGGLALVSCGTSGWPWRTMFSTMDSVRWVFARPGVYSITTDVSALGIYDTFAKHAPTDVRLEAYLQQRFIGDTCDAAGVVELDAERQTYLDFLSDVPPGWVRLRGGGRSYSISRQSLRWADESIGGAPLLCDGCGEGASCKTVTWGTALELGDDTVLRFLPGVHLAEPPWTGYVSFRPSSPDDAAP